VDRGARVGLTGVPGEGVARRRGARRQALGGVVEQADPLADPTGQRRQPRHPPEQRAGLHDPGPGSLVTPLCERGRRLARSSSSAIVRAMLPHRFPASDLWATLIALVTARALDR